MNDESNVPSRRTQTREENELRLLPVLNALLRRWRMVVLAALLGGVVLGGRALLNREFVASAVFLTNRPSVPAGGLSGIAAEFGVNLSGTMGTESPAFYARLLRSRQLLRSVLTTTFTFQPYPDGTDETTVGTLLELLGATGETEHQLMLDAVRRLDARLGVATDGGTGLVTLRVRMPWRLLSEQVAARLVGLVNEFNLETRQSQARQEREFVEARLESARAELEQAENELQEFHSENREIRPLSRLAVEAARLQRRVDVLQQVALTLAEAYEQVRIEEVRNTPAITVVDTPHGSGRRQGGVVVGALLGAMLGAAVALAWIAFSEMLGKEQVSHPGDVEEFRRLRKRFLPWLRAGEA
jgi:uncharacterized protein involved in exopolysaccharide biosynthesis